MTAKRKSPRRKPGASEFVPIGEPIALRRLSPADASDYRRVRLQALRLEPAAFGSSHAEESGLTLAQFAARLELSPERWTWGAFAGARLVGIATLARESRLKQRHKAAIYALYVERAWRGQGIGAALLALALQTSGQMRGVRQLRIAVMAANRQALRLYLKNGFTVYGREPEALHVGGRFHPELFLARKCAPAPR